MAMSKKVDKYPAEFLSLIREVAASGQAFRMLCGSEREAKAIRFQLYGFATALREDTRNPRRTAEWDHLAAALDGMQLSVLREELIFTPRRDTGVARTAMAAAAQIAAANRAARAGTPPTEPTPPSKFTDSTDKANEAILALFGKGKDKPA